MILDCFSINVCTCGWFNTQISQNAKKSSKNHTKSYIMMSLSTMHDIIANYHLLCVFLMLSSCWLDLFYLVSMILNVFGSIFALLVDYRGEREGAEVGCVDSYNHIPYVHFSYAHLLMVIFTMVMFPMVTFPMVGFPIDTFFIVNFPMVTFPMFNFSMLTFSMVT